MVQSLNATGVASGGGGPEEGAEVLRTAYALALESKSERAIDFMRGNLAGGLLKMGDHPRARNCSKQLREGGDD